MSLKKEEKWVKIYGIDVPLHKIDTMHYNDFNVFDVLYITWNPSVLNNMICCGCISSHEITDPTLTLANLNFNYYPYMDYKTTCRVAGIDLENEEDIFASRIQDKLRNLDVIEVDLKCSIADSCEDFDEDEGIFLEQCECDNYPSVNNIQDLYNEIHCHTSIILNKDLANQVDAAYDKFKNKKEKEEERKPVWYAEVSTCKVCNNPNNDHCYLHSMLLPEYKRRFLDNKNKFKKEKKKIV